MNLYGSKGISDSHATFLPSVDRATSQDEVIGPICWWQMFGLTTFSFFFFFWGGGGVIPFYPNLSSPISSNKIDTVKSHVQNFVHDIVL